MEERSATREIPKTQWKKFLDGFSRRHRGWLASVEEIGPEIGAMTEARQLFFQGIATGRGGSMTLSLGKGPEDHLEHPVASPRRVWLETLPNGAEAALEIESEEDRRTIVSFRSSLPVEMVDGLARETPAGKRRKR